jgi:hypothetical protein
MEHVAADRAVLDRAEQQLGARVEVDDPGVRIDDQDAVGEPLECLFD